MSYQQKLFIAEVGSETWTDVTNYLAPHGLEWSRINVNTAVSTTMDGVDHYARIRQKRSVTATFRELADSDILWLTILLAPTKMKIRTFVPDAERIQDLNVRASDITVGYMAQVRNKSYWKGFSVTFTED